MDDYQLGVKSEKLSTNFSQFFHKESELTHATCHCELANEQQEICHFVNHSNSTKEISVKSDNVQPRDSEFLQKKVYSPFSYHYVMHLTEEI